MLLGAFLCRSCTHHPPTPSGVSGVTVPPWAVEVRRGPQHDLRDVPRGRRLGAHLRGTGRRNWGQKNGENFKGKKKVCKNEKQKKQKKDFAKIKKCKKNAVVFPPIPGGGGRKTRTQGRLASPPAPPHGVGGMDVGGGQECTSPLTLLVGICGNPGSGLAHAVIIIQIPFLPRGLFSGAGLD